MSQSASTHSDARAPFNAHTHASIDKKEMYRFIFLYSITKKHVIKQKFYEKNLATRWRCFNSGKMRVGQKMKMKFFCPKTIRYPIRLDANRVKTNRIGGNQKGLLL
jgi:hypothetical protein